MQRKYDESKYNIIRIKNKKILLKVLLKKRFIRRKVPEKYWKSSRKILGNCQEGIGKVPEKYHESTENVPETYQATHLT